MGLVVGHAGPGHTPPCLGIRLGSDPEAGGSLTLRTTLPFASGPGNLGSQLVEYKEEMYITSDCGHTWRQVRPWGLSRFCPHPLGL